MQTSPRSRRFQIAIAAALVVAAGAAGVAYASTRDTRADTPSASSATPSAAAPATTAAAVAETTPPPALRLGKTATVSDGEGPALVTATALAYRQPVAKGAPRPDDQPGYVWGAADVKVCMKIPDQTVSRWTWVLMYADGAVIEPSSTGYVHFPNPAYPWDDQPVRVGRCVRGWIVFPVPSGERPASIQYQPDGYEPIEWRVG